MKSLKCCSLALIFGTLAACGGSKDAGQATYDSPEAAAEAFVATLESGDTIKMVRLLGPGSEWIVESGDAVQDKVARENFVKLYKAKHSLEAEGDDKRTLIVGAEDWPMPIPIVKSDGKWRLDGEAGADELILRRIGHNELGAIAVSRGIVEAQEEYAADSHDGDPAGRYALKLLSDEGRENGLYWPTEEGEEPSPAGEFVAAASEEGYRKDSGAYHGYRYRLLYAQSAAAAGGAREYFKDGVLSEGFATVAWPADYGISGVMTFIVNQDGAVYQRDLGDDTEQTVAAMTSFDPEGWALVP